MFSKSFEYQNPFHKEAVDSPIQVSSSGLSILYKSLSNPKKITYPLNTVLLKYQVFTDFFTPGDQNQTTNLKDDVIVSQKCI